ncbi:MAG: restriction endonuclease subunit S, partial [Catenibacterium mitsuokai]
IELPSIEVQRKIVNIISKSKEIVRRKENEFELLDELVRARFVEMFGDPIENTYSFPILKLGELSELITKGASPSWQGYSYTEDSTQTLFVTSENVREGYMDFSSIKYVEDAFNEKQKRSMIQKGDYLINIVGASIGRAAQFNMDCKANMNQAAALVRIKDNTISDNYLLYYLNSDKAQMMYNSMKSDTGRANLSLQDIANLEILVPDLTLQVKFASFVEEIDKSRLLNNHSLLLLKSITF